MTKFLKGAAITGMAVLAAFGVALLFAGCLGERLPLPPITMEFTVAQNVVFGPGAGIPPDTLLDNTPMVQDVTCNLPTMDDLREQIRAEVGEVAAGFIEIEAVEVQRASLVPTQGNFSTLTMVSLSGIAVGIDGIAPISVGTSTALQGFNGPIDMYPNGADLLPLFEVGPPACGAIILNASGRTPAEDVIFDGEVLVDVYFSLGL